MGDFSSLPPDYVSLAQLRDIWLKKQEEKKLREKEEEEMRKQEEEKRKQDEKVKNDGHEIIDGGTVGIVVKKLGFIHEKGKGKEIINGSYGNVKGKKNNRDFRKPKSAADEKIRVENGVPVTGVWRIRDVKRNDFNQNRGSFGSGGDIVHQLKKNDGEISVDKGYNRKKEEKGRNNHRLKMNGEAVFEGNGVDVLKQNECLSDFGDDRGFNQKRMGKGRNNRLKESTDPVLKGNGVESDETVEVLGETSVYKGKNKSRYRGQNRGYDKFKERGHRVVVGLASEKKKEISEDITSENDVEKRNEDSVKNGENECADGVDDLNQNEGASDFVCIINLNGLKESADSVLKGNGVESDETVEVLGETSVYKGKNKSGYRGRIRRYNKFKERGPRVVIGLVSEKEISEDIRSEIDLEKRNKESVKNGDDVVDDLNQNEGAPDPVCNINLDGSRESTASILKGNGVELYGTVEVLGETSVYKGKSKSWYGGRNRAYDKFKERRHRVVVGLESEKKKEISEDITNETDLEKGNKESVKNGENECEDVVDDLNQNEGAPDFVCSINLNGLKEGMDSVVISDVKKGEDETVEVSGKKEGVQNDKYKGSKSGVLKGNELELVTEKKAEIEVFKDRRRIYGNGRMGMYRNRKSYAEVKRWRQVWVKKEEPSSSSVGYN